MGSVEVGIPYSGWPVRHDTDYEFGMHSPKLSTDLTEQLLEWARFFNLNYDEELGWSSKAAKQRYVTVGEALVERIRGELGPGYVVKRVPELD